jgi:hypothetical protein
VIQPRNPVATINGIAWGSYVGNAVIASRLHDGAGAVVNFQPSSVCGHWQPTPPSFAPALLPQWPGVKPFGISLASAFRPAAPPSFDSPDFVNSYFEVYELGRIDSASRTADQTEIAFFWEDGSGSVTPPGHWQIIAQQLAPRFPLSLVDNARLFALLSIVQADCAICAWDCKYYYDHFRPITAIRDQCFSNASLPEDPGWTPLIPTPPFPGYTSGHSTFSGGSARILALVFGTDAISFSGESPDPGRWPDVLPGVVRSWTSLSQAAREGGKSRIYGGIHWNYDNLAGLDTGRKVANKIHQTKLRPR